MKSSPGKRIVWTLVALGYAATAPAAEPALLTIEDIVENVRASEKLYENLDVTLESDYQDFRVDPPAAAEPTEAHEQAENRLVFFERSTSNIHTVLQDGMFRAERTGRVVGDNSTFTNDRIRAFDGKQTRLFDQRQVANIIEGRSEDELIVRPHMFLLASMHYFVPLSTYLAGHEAMHAYPGCILPAEYTVEVTYQGEAEFDGLKCHRVWITTSTPGYSPHDRWELWLAEDRNYIPARNLAYTLRFSETNPIGEGRVHSWREVEPGVWFPSEVTMTAYDKYQSLTPDERVVAWADVSSIKEVSLTPEYDVAYFRDVQFPDGIPVYEVADARIVDGYVQGAPRGRIEGAASKKGGLAAWLLLVSVNLVLASGALWMVWWRKTSRTERTRTASG